MSITRYLTIQANDAAVSILPGILQSDDCMRFYASRIGIPVPQTRPR